MHSRPLTTAERYYAFLDPVAPMNLLLVADLDACPPAPLVARRWSEFVALRCLPRLQVHGDLTLSDAAADPDFLARTCPPECWDIVLAQESGTSFGLGRSMGCRYLAAPDGQRSRLYLVVHHAITDGRRGIAELQAFLRFLDGQRVVAQAQLPPPAAAERPPPWQGDRNAFLSLLRTIRERNERAGEPAPRDWPRSGDAGRAGGTGVADGEPRFQSLSIEPGPASALLAEAKKHGARAYPAMASAWLCSVCDVLELAAPVTLQLATPVDLAAPAPDPAAPRAAAISVLSHRYRVDADGPWTLARSIGDELVRASEAGEGELFFTLARVGSAADVESGSEIVARALAGAPPAVSVTNLGILDPGSDPPWVRSLCGYLAPTPNQVAFVSGLGYRGRLVHSIATSDRRWGAQAGEALVARYRRRIAAMSEGEGRP